MTRRLTWLAAVVAGGTGLAVMLLGLAFVPLARWEVFVPAASALVGVAVVLALTLAQSIGESIAGPLRQIVRAVESEQFQGDGWNDTVVDYPPEEVAPLLGALRRTRANLRATMIQLERDRAEVATIFEHMADGVVVLDTHERVQLANPAAQRLLRQGGSPLAGKRLVEITRDPDLLAVVRSVGGRAPVVQLLELIDTTGRPRRWIQVIGARLPAPERVLLLLQDVTELRRAEAARRDFVANISHELRTPIASLKALAETLEDGALDEPEVARDFVRRMHVEVDGLAHMVTELLELARVEAGRMTLDRVAMDPQALVGDAVERVRPYAERLELRVHAAEVSSDNGNVPFVLADRPRIGQVFANLLSNAMKFTPPGGQVEVGCRSSQDGMEFWVSDTGVGIERENLSRVFERFYKTDPARATPGTGLGLAICKHLVQAHGGRIWAESGGEGRGATFRFTLPLAPAETQTLPEPEAHGSLPAA